MKSDLNKIVLVLGDHAGEIIKVLGGKNFHHPKLSVIENRQYRQGISSSILAGLLEVEETFDHVMILLADMPHIDAKLINFLLYRYLDSRLPIGAIRFKGKRSHPVIFSRAMYYELRRLRGDKGARALFLKYSDRVYLVDPGALYDDMDIDTPEDYVEFRKLLGDE